MEIMSKNKNPENSWWVINGEELLSALKSCYNGENPDIIYIELWANSKTENYD